MARECTTWFSDGGVQCESYEHAVLLDCQDRLEDFISSNYDGGEAATVLRFVSDHHKALSELLVDYTNRARVVSFRDDQR